MHGGARVNVSGELSIRGLETLVWLARLRNFRACAEELHTTQPAISARIAALEQTLGVRLFERDRRSVRLTPEGADALTYAEAILDQVGALRERFATSARLIGRVRIGVIDTVARTWLPDFLALQERHAPGIKLEIINGPTELLERLLARGELQVIVTIRPAQLRDVESAALGRMAMAWLAKPGRFVARRYTPADVFALPIISYRRDSPPFGWQTAYFGRPLPEECIRISTDSMSTMLWLAERGVGVAAIPLAAARQHIVDGRLAGAANGRAAAAGGDCYVIVSAAVFADGAGGQPAVAACCGRGVGRSPAVSLRAYL